MGQRASSVDSAAGGSADASSSSLRPSRMRSLAKTGRYVVLRPPAPASAPLSPSPAPPAPLGASVHILGVYPCSPISEEEAFDLVRALQPSVLYIDLPPDMLHAAVSEVTTPTPLLETYPPLTTYGPTSTLLSSLLFVRQKVISNQMTRLVGCEAWAPFKSAIAAVAPFSSSCDLCAYPFQLKYNNYSETARPSHVAVESMGNAGPGSNALIVAIGRPTSRVNDVEHVVEVPAVGYFNSSQLSATQRSFREKTSAVSRCITLESGDVEVVMAGSEAAAREAGEVETAGAIASAISTSQRQSAAIAWTLQQAAMRLKSDEHVVAIINIGQAASVVRQWDTPLRPEEAIPPMPAMLQYTANAAQGGVLAALGYGYYRGVRRFPRTGAALGLLLAAGAASAAYGVTHMELMMYGTQLRAALVRPRVTSPLMRVDK